MSRWRKRKPSSIGNVDGVERISSLRTSVARCDFDAGLHRCGRQRRYGAAMEDLTLDRPALHDDAHVAVERVDACLEERVDRRRNDDLAVAAVLAHHREHLLDVERVPGRRVRDALPQHRRRATASGDERVHELGALLRRQRLEQERRRVQLAAAPARPNVEQLGARDAEQEDRRIAREVGDVLDEVDEDRLGPLQVVDNHDLRALRRPRLEQPPKGELRLRRRPADDRIRLDADRDQDLDERPVGDPLAVGEAATAQDVGRRRRRARGSRRRGATCRSPPGRAE